MYTATEVPEKFFGLKIVYFQVANIPLLDFLKCILRHFY